MVYPEGRLSRPNGQLPRKPLHECAMLNVDRSGLLTICIYPHARWIRNLIPLTCYTLSFRKTSHDN